MRLALPLIVSTAALSGPALAVEVTLNLDIPQLNVAEYHNPYVAVWIEKPGQAVMGNLAVWYDLKNPKNEGDKWLKDLRQWWRRTGRELAMPVDGISGATKPPGTHAVGIDTGAAPFADLPPGEYKLVVEAAREVGGREVVQIPFSWPPQAEQKLEAKGSNELGNVVLEIKP